MFPAIYRSVIHSAMFMIRAIAISYVVIYQCEYPSSRLYFMFLLEWQKLSFFSLDWPTGRACDHVLNSSPQEPLVYCPEQFT